LKIHGPTGGRALHTKWCSMIKLEFLSGREPSPSTEIPQRLLLTKKLRQHSKAVCKIIFLIVMNTFHICNYVWILIYKKCVLIILNECNALFFWHRFYETWISIIAFTRTHHRFPFWTVWTFYTRNLHWLKVLWLQLLIHFASPSILAACPVHLIRDHRKTILWSVKIMKILIMQLFTFIYYCLLYRSTRSIFCLTTLSLCAIRGLPCSVCGGQNGTGTGFSVSI
jgi:hypothetical protein